MAGFDSPGDKLRSDLIPEVIDGVEIHCLSPDESLQNVYFSTYRRKLADPGIEIPDTNLISAVLALKLGESVVLLGADALKRNWESVVKHYSKRALPKAIILKVPHHGARNALNLQRKQPNYLDLCSHSPKATAVIFAGDSKHPDPDVFAKLRSRTTTICLSNGRKSKLESSNPLHLQIPNARAVGPARVCNPVVSFELNAKGDVSLLAGIECESGCFAPAA